MRCQTPSRYVSHAIVRLIGSALAASAPSTCGTMVEKRPLPISEERRRETSLSRFFIQNPFFSKKADQKGKNMVIALHCLFFVFIERFIQCLADYRYLSLSNMPFFALPFALSSLIGSISRSSHGACLSLSVPAKNKWRRWAGGRSRSIIPAN